MIKLKCRSRSLHTRVSSCSTETSHSCCRRSLLVAGPVLLGTQTAGAKAAGVADLFDNNASIQNPGPSWAVTDRYRQLVYPSWMEGTWQVTASFDSVKFPQGQRFITKTLPGVLKGSIIMVLPDVGAAQERPVMYQQRYVQSPAFAGVIADRVFNAQQLVDAFLGYPAVRQVDYKPEANPTRMAVVYATPRKDQSEVVEDLRKAEIFINNRTGEQLGAHFFASEMYRQVTQAAQQGYVSDYEVLWDITRQSEDDLAVRQRVAAFLQPQDAAFFETGNKAVALYDYRCTLRRLPTAAA